MNVLMRADASHDIGTGHVVRCLTLAEALREAGAAVHFACRELAGDMIGYLRQRGFTCHRLEGAGAPGQGWEADALQSAVVAESIGKPEWVMVDHYGLDARWESKLRAHCARLVAIDDLVGRAHACDLLLNQNLIPGAAARYESLVPRHCRLLLGPEYALLRPEFRDLRQQRTGGELGPVERVLVYFGGSDKGDLTSRVLDLLERHAPSGLQIDALVGIANVRRNAIEARFGNRSGLRILAHTENVAGVIAGSQLAIGAGGASIWERCCLGLPAVVVAIADNQVEVARNAAKAGACLYAGTSGEVSDDALRASFLMLLHNESLRESLSRAGRSMVDGLGCERVAKELLLPDVTLRPATLDDAALVFPWRNAAQTRVFSHDPEPLTLARHIEWFRAALADPTRVLLIGESRSRPVGVLRYDLEGSLANVSIYLDPGLRGRGYGTAMLLQGEQWLLRDRRSSITAVRAEIRAGNTASHRAFERAGFTEVMTSMCKVLMREGANAHCDHPFGEGQ